MGDAGIVTDENTGLAEPARKLVKILYADRAGEFFFGPREPVDRHRPGQAARNPAEDLHGRAFRWTAGEGVEDGETSRRFRTSDGRKARSGSSAEAAGLVQIELDRMAGAGRKSRQELERQMADELAEFGAIGAVPGNDRIEGRKASHDVLGRQQAEAVKSSGDNGLGGIGEASQRYVWAGAPDFRIIGPERFERGKTDDEIANRTWANQKASQVNPLL